MRPAVLAGLAASLAAAVGFFAVGLLLAGYAAVSSGVLWLALAGERARPSRWTPAEVEHDQRRHHG